MTANKDFHLFCKLSVYGPEKTSTGFRLHSGFGVSEVGAYLVHQRSPKDPLKEVPHRRSPIGGPPKVPQRRYPKEGPTKVPQRRFSIGGPQKDVPERSPKGSPPKVPQRIIEKNQKRPAEVAEVIGPEKTLTGSRLG